MPAASATRAGRGPRTLAEDLRARPDEALVRLLQARPDLAVPPPPDLGALATRATSRAGVRHVLDTLTTAHLQVLDVLAVLDEPCTPAAVSRTWGANAAAVLDDLRALALVWGAPRALHLVRTVRDLLGPYPGGLGPPLAEALDRRSPQRLAALLDDLGLPPQPDPPRAAAALVAHLGDARVLDGLLAQAPEGTRDLLDRLAWGPPVGAVADADREVRRAQVAGPGVAGASPVDWLLAHGVLAVADPGHVVLPRELGLALRGGRVHRDPAPTPPPLLTDDASTRPQPDRSGATAAHAAAEAVRLTTELAQSWAAAPPSVLRAGGLGVRDLRRAAVALDADPGTVALLAEVALAAGLIADDGEADPRWAPTPAFDDWLDLGTGQRWTWLAAAWVDTPAAAHLTGGRDARDAVIAPLSAATRRPDLPSLRRGLLADLLTSCPPGRVVRGAQDGARAQLAARLAWARPRRHTVEVEAVVAAAVEEAALLGLAVAGSPSPALRAAFPMAGPAGASADRAPAAPPVPDWDAAAAAVDAALPAPVDHLLLQADLTAIAPGPLVPDLQRAMDTLADVDSRGGATVYRFTTTSLRRALDAGMTGEEVLALLRTHSRTGVPQPLEYLVADVARRHGTLRVGAAASFVRTDDTAALDEVLADRRAARLQLRRLAPTVACSPLGAAELLEGLRGLGLAPAAEGVGGALLLAAPRGHRAAEGSGRRRVRSDTSGAGSLGGGDVVGPPRIPEESLLRMIRAVRSAEERAAQPAPAHAGGTTSRGSASRGSTSRGSTSGDLPTPPPAPAVPEDPHTVLASLRLAADRRGRIWVSLVEADGRTATRLVEPLTVDGGLVTAVDTGAGRLRSFPVHRIRSVTPA